MILQSSEYCAYVKAEVFNMMESSLIELKQPSVWSGYVHYNQLCTFIIENSS